MSNKEVFENLSFSENYPFIISFQNSPETFPLHWHHYVEIIYSMQDSVIYEVNEKQYNLSTGDILFIWPGELHSLISQPQPSEVLVLQFADHLLTERKDLRNYMYHFHHTRCLHSDKTEEYLQKMRNLLLELKNVCFSKETFAETKSYLLIYDFFLTLGEELKRPSFRSTVPETPHNTKVMEQLYETCNYLATHCTDDITLEFAAHYAGFSKFHFSKLFKQYTGQSFPEFLSIERLRIAENLLKNPELSITQVSQEAGFNSISSFNRIFMRYKKVSPSLFRNMHLM